MACSDIHGSKDNASKLVETANEGKYDLVVVCGDFTTYGTTEFAKDFLKRIKCRVLGVPGNCDVPDTVGVLEEARASVHNARVEIEGRSFFGFGGALPSGAEMPFEIAEDLLERSLREIAVPEGVMVTHVPAYGMNDRTRFGSHGGSEGVLRIAREFKPVLALAGHIHEAQGRALNKDTIFVNPGPAKHGCYASIVLGESADIEFFGSKKQCTNPATY